MNEYAGLSSRSSSRQYTYELVYIYKECMGKLLALFIIKNK